VQSHINAKRFLALELEQCWLSAGWATTPARSMSGSWWPAVPSTPGSACTGTRARQCCLLLQGPLSCIVSSLPAIFDILSFLTIQNVVPGLLCFDNTFNVHILCANGNIWRDNRRRVPFGPFRHRHC
jgi:hypothetical protein